MESQRMKNITFVSASAGSGKTYRVVQEIIRRLAGGQCRPEGLVATTYTKKAAGELRARLAQELYKAGHHELAERLDTSLIGTVHSVCQRLLQRFAFEAGISPDLEVMTEDQSRLFLNQAVETVAVEGEVEEICQLGERLGHYDPKANQHRWKDQVREIVGAARANDIAAECLKDMADANAKAVLGFLQPAATEDLDARIVESIDGIEGKIEGNNDGQKNTHTYLELVKAFRDRLKGGSLPWSDWAKLAKTAPGKAFKDEAACVADLALQVDAHPRLHQDIRDYTRLVFDLAARTMDAFQRLKQERGVVDFSDLEQLALHLLRVHPGVTEILKQELQFVVVDEFQDTSPIQLALFTRLAECAQEVLWVGDVKQAIYGFRGSDPELVESVVDALQRAGGTIAPPLDQSWRSRRELVDLSSELFVPAFAEGLQLPPEQVALQVAPNRVSPDYPPVAFLDLSSGRPLKTDPNRLKSLKNSDYAATLARGMESMLQGQPPEVLDKETGELRSAGCGDVAVLCRSNTVAQAMAAALAARNLPVKLAEKGLLQTPEAMLALACLRRLADGSDTLAAAEIVALQTTHSPEQWLAGRLDYLAERDTQEDRGPDQWGLVEPFVVSSLQAIESLRNQLPVLSPAEALDAVMTAADVPGTATVWGPTAARAAQRRANLEALRGFMEQYETFCTSSRLPATIAGFIAWAQQQAEAGEDAKAVDPQADGIYVGTYHSAKGLEWPVVVCSDLDAEPRPRYWSVTACPASEEKPFDFAAPLANRFIRFWVFPFGGQEKGVAMLERVENSKSGERILRQAQHEDLRLLYVGITRARDVLALARDVAKPTPWLNSLGAAAWLKDQENTVKLPSGKAISCQTLEWTPSEGLPVPVVDKAFHAFPAPVARTPKPVAALIPSAQGPLPEAEVGEVLDLQARLPLAGNPEDAILGDALHAILAAELLNPARPDRMEIISRILAGHEISSHLQVADVEAMLDRFIHLLQERFRPRQIHVEVPFHSTNETGQRIDGIMDLVLETGDGWVVIDHKSFPGPRTAWREKALSYSGQLALYRHALKQVQDRPVQTWIHFTIGGGLVEVR